MPIRRSAFHSRLGASGGFSDGVQAYRDNHQIPRGDFRNHEIGSPPPLIILKREGVASPRSFTIRKSEDAANRAILAKRTQFPAPKPNGESRDFRQTNPISALSPIDEPREFRRTKPIFPPRAERRTSQFWPNEADFQPAGEGRKELSLLGLTPKSSSKPPRRTNPIGEEKKGCGRATPLVDRHSRPSVAEFGRAGMPVHPVST